MTYNFETVLERRGTNSLKWDMTEALTGVQDVLPMWVADMDFKSPPAVIDALKERVEHGIFGYSGIPDSCYEAIIAWMKKRHGWEVQKEWILFTPGVVPAFHWVVRAFTHPGNNVILQPPVYYPFFNAVTYNGCQIIENELHYHDGHYEIDFEQLERQFDARTKVFLLCSPHNPVGRVWTQEELTRLGELCLRHKVVLCSDEIHSDLILRGFKHTPTAMISDEIAQNTITCCAANKTFNIAGLTTGFVIIPHPDLRQQFAHAKHNTGLHLSNLFGILATEAAYRHGEDWLEQLLDYLQGNLEYLTGFIEDKISHIRVVKPEGTYLAWLDCRELHLKDAKLREFLLEEARLWLVEGSKYGRGGAGFQRLNFACPRETLKDGLRRLGLTVNVYQIEDYMYTNY